MTGYRTARAAKRQYGEGSISAYTTNAGVRYAAQLYVPVDHHDPDGKKQRKKKGGFASKREAAAWLRDESAALARGFPSPTGDGPTLREFMSEWLDGHRAGATTMAAYRRMYRLHIEPNLGDTPLGRLRPSTLARLYRQLEKNGMKAPGRERHPLGPNTVKKVHSLLSVCFQAALEDGLIAVNPARQPGAKPPSGSEVKAAKREMTVWRPDELARFITWASRHDPDMADVWLLASRTGLRRSELAGLRWEDIDMNRNRMTVRRSRVVIKEKGKSQRVETKPPKNGRPRVVDLDDYTVEELRQMRTSVAVGPWV